MGFPSYPQGITRDAVHSVPPGLRLDQRSTVVPAASEPAVAALIRSWDFKRRAGFTAPTEDPILGQEGLLGKRVLGIRFTEPIRVIWADESGFGYETRPGHPLFGEESFRMIDGVFSARSVSRPSSALWWILSPALRIFQAITHRRYIRIVEDTVRRNEALRVDG